MRNTPHIYHRWTTISRHIRTYIIAGLFLTIVLFPSSLQLTDTAFGFLILVPLFIYNGLQRALQTILLYRRVHIGKISLLFGGLTLMEAGYIASASFIAPHLGQLGYLFPLMLWIAAILQFQRWTDRLVQNSTMIESVRLSKEHIFENQYQVGEGIEMRQE